MDGARDVLSWAKDAGIEQFVYTHKGENALVILRDLGLESFFYRDFDQSKWFCPQAWPRSCHVSDGEVRGGARKYLLYWDRSLDIDFARNSQIQSINFLTSDYQGNHQMNTLLDIPGILNAEKNL